MLTLYSNGNFVNKQEVLKPKNNIIISFDIVTNCDVFIQVEPEAICSRRNFLIKNYDNFKNILTFDQEVLEKCPNAIKYIYGTSWIKEEEYNSIISEKKEFKISMIVGHKYSTNGHRLRKYILDNENNLRNIDFYVSNKFVKEGKELVGPSKFKTFHKYQYQIIIENSQQTNYFTEKLVDCLITKTIPIYWGCPNISEYFNTTGWIIFNNFEELKIKLDSLVPNDYFNYENIIQSNFKKAILYENFYKNINNGLSQIKDY
jgi:hypothetical protein